MNLSTYKKKLEKPLRQYTEVFLIDTDNIMLGLKKTGLGAGNIIGIGGKVEPNETLEQAAIREVQEEVEITIENLEYSGNVIFYFPHIKDESWNISVHIYTSKKWSGTPKETIEISPFWFHKTSIPYEKMWDDARLWVPQVIANKKIFGEFLYAENMQVADYNVKELLSNNFTSLFKTQTQ